jgi:hypothetical protein
MDPKTRQHDIVRVELVIDAVPPGKRAARQHQVINGGGTCSSKKPETTPHVEQRRARAAIKLFGPCSLVSLIDSAGFPWSQRFFLGFMIVGSSRTCGIWRDCSGAAVRHRRGRTTWPSCWRSSLPRGGLLVLGSNVGRSRTISRPGIRPFTWTAATERRAGCKVHVRAGARHADPARETPPRRAPPRPGPWSPSKPVRAQPAR